MNIPFVDMRRVVREFGSRDLVAEEAIRRWWESDSVSNEDVIRVVPPLSAVVFFGVRKWDVAHFGVYLGGNVTAEHEANGFCFRHLLGRKESFVCSAHDSSLFTGRPFEVWVMKLDNVIGKSVSSPRGDVEKTCWQMDLLGEGSSVRERIALCTRMMHKRRDLYSLFQLNCEDVTRYILTGSRKSVQVDFALSRYPVCFFKARDVEAERIVLFYVVLLLGVGSVPVLWAAMRRSTKKRKKSLLDGTTGARKGCDSSLSASLPERLLLERSLLDEGDSK